jgi:glycyl-tRNA synthetase beta chain
MSTADLLIELLTEELPPKALARLSDSLSQQVHQALVAKGLAGTNARVTGFATPRRLGLRISEVANKGDDRALILKGPSLKVALDAAGHATQALVKWAEKQGIAIDQLERSTDGKQEIFSARTTLAGETLAAVIGPVLNAALGKLPIPKLMQYQLADGTTTVEFVRPARSLIVLHGSVVVPASVLGLAAGRTTLGHRFQSMLPITIDNAGSYESQLTHQGRVMASLDERRAHIHAQLLQQASRLEAHLGDEGELTKLLDEVNALVEWPAVYVGEFDPEFLAVPPECLILTMRTNQKYFPLFDRNGQLLAKFLIVSNMAIDDPSLIIDGNQRVVRPRLSDARFFFEQDQKQTLEARLPKLASVVYHAKLGTQADRVARVRAIAHNISVSLNAPAVLADRAAQLAKADLLSGMVGEFPELQGTMGRYYALHDGELPEVADAIADQYRPRFAGDDLPRALTGVILALADKLETLCGLFAIGQQPSGDRDPFALRRHGLGVLRMLVERQLPIDLKRLIEQSLTAFDDRHKTNAQAGSELWVFLQDRLAGYLRERSYTSAEIAAVLAASPTLLAEVPERLAAVRSFSALAAAQSLAAANKRIGNILKKSTLASGAAIDPQLLREPAERQLAEVIGRLTPQVAACLQARDFSAALALLAQAREPVDAFFTDVMVMAEDLRLRDNRLALISELHQLMNQVADISKLSA